MVCYFNTLWKATISCTVYLYLILNTIQAQNVGIGTATPHSSAKLHIEDTQRGILIPKVALVDIADGINPVNLPAVGLLVWNTNSGVINGAGTGFYYWTGVIWEKIVTSNATSTNTAWELLGNAGTLNGTNFLGTTDNQALDIRTNNTIFTRITTKGQIEVLNTGESVFIGETAGENDDLTTNRNVFVGYRVGTANTSGSRNTALGHTALENNTIGTQNVAIGHTALRDNTSGNFNTALGTSTLELNTTGSQNIAIGLEAMEENISGSLNIGIGSIALNKNTSGTNNIGIGFSALNNNTTGYDNIALGNSALAANTTSYENVGIGAGTLNSNTTGFANTAIGSAALGDNTTGRNNLAVGHTAVALNVDGEYNTGVGPRALFGNISGDNNVALGRQALFSNTSGSNNTAIGYDAYLTGTHSNSTAIGAGASISASNQMRFGNNVITSIGGFASWTNVSDKRFKTNVKENVVGLAFINQLRPVTYNLDMDNIAKLQNIPDSLRSAEAESVKAAEVQTGFIAQEVEAAANKVNYDFSGIDAPKNENDHYGLRYAEFTVPLVKAVQELSEENNQLKSKLNSLETEMQALRKLLESKE